MTPKLEKFLRRALIECPGHAVILITINETTGKAELMSNFQDQKDMNEAIFNLSSVLPRPKTSFFDKLKSFFNLKTKNHERTN